MNDLIFTIQNIISSIVTFAYEHKLELLIGVITSILGTAVIYSLSKLKIVTSLASKNISNYFKSNAEKIESIEIQGATIIGENFVKKVTAIGKKQKYCASDFYLAKQYEYCQWYGIINKFDIEKDAYKRIKEEVKYAFDDELRQPKIVALIYGRGGSGKSTLMRRLAVDSINENYCVLWINDKEIATFYEKGIDQISNYSNIKFLILIEDWYRVKQNTANAQEIMNNICNYSNVRVIIGDRTIDNSVSKENIFNPDENIIELSVNENKKTITKILNIIPSWKSTAEELLKNEEDYKSSLYLILWVIARKYQSKNKTVGGSQIKSEGLIGHFQTLVESDLRLIAKHYSGLAKMLYYLGSIYSKQKTYIGFDVFIKLADLFKDNPNSSKLAFASKEIKPILDIYINQTVGLIKAAGKLPLVAFNHDILADEGLSKAQLDGWHKFDDSIILQMLPVIINEGDDFSASNFLYNIVSSINKESFTDEEIIKYIKILFDKGNRGSYLTLLFNKAININEKEKHKYAITILDNFLNSEYYIPTICLCLNHIRSLPEGRKATSDILTHPDLLKLPKEIVTTALNISKNEDEKKKAAVIILSQPDFFKLPFEIVSLALKKAQNEKEGKKATTEILSHPDFFSLPKEIIATALNFSKNVEEQKNAAVKILFQSDFFKLSYEIVSLALKIAQNEKEGKKAMTDILSRPDFFKLPKEIVTTAMKFSKNEEERKKAASDILSQPDFFRLPKEIVSTAIKILKNEEEGKKAASDILSQPDFFKLPKEIVSTAMNISKNEEEKKKAAVDILSQPDLSKLPKETITIAMKISKDVDKAFYFLNNWEKTDWSIVIMSLHCFSNQAKYPQIIIDIVNNVISNKGKGGLHYYRYIHLLSVPLQGIQPWENECNGIINHYYKSKVSLINSVLKSHRLFPKKIKKLCSIVLSEWKSEIIKPIRSYHGAPHLGDNVNIALGHPELRALAKQMAKEIINAESKKQANVPKYLLEVSNSIINQNKFPEWNLEIL